MISTAAHDALYDIERMVERALAGDIGRGPDMLRMLLERLYELRGLLEEREAP